MQALVCERYGSPETLRLMEVEDPIPRDNEVLVRLSASTVNRTDYAYIRGYPSFVRIMTGLLRPKHTIPGTDFAGEVMGIGKDVSSFTVGDRVFGFNDRTYGGHAPLMTVPEHAGIVRIPDGVSYENAVASAEGGFYALAFFDKVSLRKGNRVVVNGGTGAIGSSLIQLLSDRGIDVTATSTPDRMEMVRSLGASRVIDYTKDDFTRMDPTEGGDRDGQGPFDHVFDAVGKSSYFKCRHLIRPGGTYISTDLGYLWQNALLPLTTRIAGKWRVMIPIPEDVQESLRTLATMLAEGRFTPVIDRTYPNDRIIEAYQYVATGEKIGNVVITYPEG